MRAERRCRALTMAVAGVLYYGGTSCAYQGALPTETAPPPEASAPAGAPVSSAPVAQAPVQSERAARMLAHAAAAVASGDRFESQRTLERIVADQPETVEALEARLRLGEAAVERRAWSVALGWVELTPTAGPGIDSYRRWRVIARAHEGSARYRQASQAWAQAQQVAQGPVDTERVARGLSRSLALGGDAEEAAAVWDGADGADPAGAMIDAIAAEATPEIITRLYEGLQDPTPWGPWVALKEAQGRCQAGALERCRDAATRAVVSPDPAIRDGAEALLAKVQAWDTVDPRAIGVLLPLSGPVQRIGQHALEGIRVALEDRAGVRLVVKDTRGDAEEAARQAERVILEGHVAVIVGPVGRHESRAVREVTQRYGIPHVFLSSDHDVASGAPHLLRLRMSRVEQSRALARYAVTTLNLRSIGILFPEQASAKSYVFGFWDEFVRLGGEVRAVASYAADETQFVGPIQALIGASDRGPGTVDFDGLFIPDDGATVRRLVPFLKYMEIPLRTHPGVTVPRSVQLLGTGGWNRLDVIDRGDNLTDNSVFVDAFFHDPRDGAADGFARAFYRRHRRQPTTFHAEVHDATLLVVEALSGLEGAHHGVRQVFLSRLKSGRSTRGATGHIRILEDGTVLRQPHLLTIDRDEIRPRLSEVEETDVRRKRLQGQGDDGPQ